MTDVQSLPRRALFVDDELAVLEMYRKLFDSGDEVSELEVRLRELERRLAGRRSDRPKPPPVDAVFHAQAEEAVEAVRRALREQAPFCAAFLDVRMPPGRDGIWAAEQIRTLDPDVEIVVVTAYSDIDPAEIARRVPPVEQLLYLQKPFHPHEVRQLFRTLAERWETRRRQRTDLQALRQELADARQKATLEEAARRRAESDRPPAPSRPSVSPGRLTLGGGMALGFLVAISEDGALLELGAGIERVLGIPARELRGKTIDALFARPADAKAVMVALAVQGGLTNHPARLRAADGVVEATISLSPRPGGLDGYEGLVSSSAPPAPPAGSRPSQIPPPAPANDATRRVLDGAIHALLSAVEARDPYTAAHQRRVALLSAALSQELGLPRDLVETIGRAGLVHDVGKLSVPPEILGKPGPLTPDEWTVVRGHAQAGHDILAKIEFDRPVARIVLEHHERLDGSGYPGGLLGDSLLLESRVLAVADVVEAIASHRPYRPALGIDAALGEIQNRRGTLFEPGVVDACVKLFHSGRFRF
ncbi:MAG: HD domain-containing protein [Deltaproteobacteria bacterium]|nr:HD domain-containing protein [Deltaproteobacteria bacterium]